jgi:hypothetical protein
MPTTTPTRQELQQAQALKALQSGLPTLGRTAGSSSPAVAVSIPKEDILDSVTLLSIHDIVPFEGVAADRKLTI